MSIRSIIQRATCALAALFVLGMAAPAKAAGPYVDIWDALPTWQQQDGWLDTAYWLKVNFNDICGDTFCEGEYPNLEALSYRCSVDSASGTVGECVFIFAASQETVSPSDGRIIAEPRNWQCATPLAPGTTAAELAQALSNTNPLFTPLPRTGKTIYDSLTDHCLY
ncbi:hypothetical protein [Dyella mobilis]|uniref:Secreted protein n=1 Tax=Dyella mobilis TaxID=1849582 RepID=A0ABS2KL89_9GAMM|nr:hypothetical protein [Dyella mobilis]MBM7131925.1 hypothetical protein [Dyella mobilis]GLQ96092.1 hypothetical protein GCM10007863_05100 [Dyella mobilis]